MSDTDLNTVHMGLAAGLRDRLFNLLSQDETTSLPSTEASEEPLIHAEGLPEPIHQRYRIHRILGKGAFGMVYLARDLRIGRLIALKGIALKPRANINIRDQLVREARVAGQLDHVNLATIYDVEDDGDNACIVMEYLAGGNLGSVLDAEGQLSVERALRYTQGILSGLDAAHRNGVVHRDIKPQNILFGQRDEPKVSDFGVAHSPIDPESELLVAGTPAYMAPEQMTAGAPVDQRADLYSCGMILYECLTGVRPYILDYEESNFGSIQKSFECREMASLSEVAPELHDDVVTVVETLLAEEPDSRYDDAAETMEAVGEALRRLRASQPSPQVVRPAQMDLRKDMFADILRLFLVDGVVSIPERRDLNRRRERLGVPLQAAEEIEEAVRCEMNLPSRADLIAFEKRAEELLRDREFSEDDENNLATLAERYRISAVEQRRIEDRVMAKYHIRSRGTEPSVSS